MKVSYGSGSGQQSVTAINSVDDNNSFWIVRGPHNKRCVQGHLPISQNHNNHNINAILYDFGIQIEQR